MPMFHIHNAMYHTLAQSLSLDNREKIFFGLKQVWYRNSCLAHVCIFPIRRFDVQSIFGRLVILLVFLKPKFRIIVFVSSPGFLFLPRSFLCSSSTSLPLRLPEKNSVTWSEVSEILKTSDIASMWIGGRDVPEMKTCKRMEGDSYAFSSSQ